VSTRRGRAAGVSLEGVVATSICGQIPRAHDPSELREPVIATSPTETRRRAGAERLDARGASDPVTVTANHGPAPKSADLCCEAAESGTSCYP